MRPVAPDPELIEWLWSEDGVLWHQQNIRRVAHAHGCFAELKRDHECDPEDPVNCTAQAYSPHPDHVIWNELRKYGMSGVPEEWKER